jgi:hypothetical protein
MKKDFDPFSRSDAEAQRFDPQSLIPSISSIPVYMVLRSMTPIKEHFSQGYKG